MNVSDIKFYTAVFWRRFPYFLIVFVMVTGAGLTLATLLPAVYRSSSTVLVEPGQISEDLAQSTVEVASLEVVQIIQRHLFSRETLLAVGERQHVFENAEAPLTDAEKAQYMRAHLFFEVLVSEERRKEQPTPTVILSFEGPDPVIAAAVVNDFVDLMLQTNQELRTGRASDTLAFFETEVDRLGEQLDGISGEILEFKNENIDSLPESLEFRRAEQGRLQERLTQIENESATLREARARLIEVYESTGRLLESESDLTPSEEELQTLRRELEQDLAVFSPTNPRILLLKSRVAALERRVAEENAVALANTPDADRGSNELQLQLSTYDSRLAQLEKERDEQRTQLEAVGETIRATPINEVKLSTLQRRYDNIRRQYDEAVASLASAATGERIETLSKGERFTVIEQAVPSGSPDRPNRLLIAAGSVAAGMLAGLGLVALLELLNGAIRRPEDLADKLQIQAFGAVPYIRTRRETMIKRLTIGGAVVTAFVILPLLTYMVHLHYMPLDALLGQLSERAGMAKPVPDNL